MTPKEKAEQLVKKMYYSLYENRCWVSNDDAKICALVCINEVIQSTPSEPSIREGVFAGYKNALQFWQSVKTEIEKL